MRLEVSGVRERLDGFAGVRASARRHRVEVGRAVPALVDLVRRRDG
ncbi:hypothetical protein AB0A74_14420 [Saccharothrix sp. NPDC042600]|nr:hypothetical protein GCM10017745_59380 [Saccharothrix mutabilis subsp. capreolus]